LRDAKRHYVQSPQDISVTPEVVRKHALRDGLWIKGEIRRSARGSQLFKLTEINGEHPDRYKNLPVFEELTSLNPKSRIRLETVSDRYTTRADINCRVILVTDFPVVRLGVETPNGKVIEESNAAAFGVRFDTATNLKTSSFNLPVAFQATKVHSGTWYALLEVDENRFKRVVTGDPDRAHGTDQAALVELRAKGAKYCVSMHSFSNLRMNATVTQSGFVPGSTLFLRAVLTEYSLPVEHRAKVLAEIEYPDKSHATVSLTEEHPGVFFASLVAMQAGIYRFRIVATGGTFRGVAFTREQLATAACGTAAISRTSRHATAARVTGAAC
jgi:hypothetical protein